MRPYTVPTEYYHLMVPQVGLEPTRISALASKTSVATITPPGHLTFKELKYIIYPLVIVVNYIMAPLERFELP